MHLASISATSLILLGACTSALAADPPAVPANGAEFPDGIERGMSLDAWQMQQRIPKPESWTTTLSTTGTWTITGSTVGNTAPNGEPPGGSAAAQPLRPPPQAETERKPEVRTVSLEDIQDQQVRIIGKLRCALWTVVTVHGSWHYEESKPQPPVFRVTDVNGKPLARAADFDKIEPESGKGGDETRRTVGQVWELRCFETGGFIGAPDEAYKEIGGPPVQRPPQGFVTSSATLARDE